MSKNRLVPDFAPDVRGNQTFRGLRQNFFGDECGNSGIESVEHDNAIMMISSDNHASHRSEFVAADRNHHVEQFAGIGLVDSKCAFDNVKLVSKFFVVNVRSASGNFFRAQSKISGGHCGGDSRIANSHLSDKKTVATGGDGFFGKLFTDSDGLGGVVKSHCAFLSDILRAARNFPIDKPVSLQIGQIGINANINDIKFRVSEFCKSIGGGSTVDEIIAHHACGRRLRISTDIFFRDAVICAKYERAFLRFADTAIKFGCVSKSHSLPLRTNFLTTFAPAFFTRLKGATRTLIFGLISRSSPKSPRFRNVDFILSGRKNLRMTFANSSTSSDSMHVKISTAT